MGEGSPSDLLCFMERVKKLRLMLVNEIEDEARHEVDDDGKQYPYHSDWPELS